MISNQHGVFGFLNLFERWIQGSIEEHALSRYRHGRTPILLSRAFFFYSSHSRHYLTFHTPHYLTSHTPHYLASHTPHYPTSHTPHYPTSYTQSYHTSYTRCSAGAICDQRRNGRDIHRQSLKRFIQATEQQPLARASDAKYKLISAPAGFFLIATIDVGGGVLKAGWGLRHGTRLHVIVFC
jgi:hypothetical protein